MSGPTCDRNDTAKKNQKSWFSILLGKIMCSMVNPGDLIYILSHSKRPLPWVCAGFISPSVSSVSPKKKLQWLPQHRRHTPHSPLKASMERILAINPNTPDDWNSGHPSSSIIFCPLCVWSLVSHLLLASIMSSAHHHRKCQQGGELSDPWWLYYVI